MGDTLGLALAVERKGWRCDRKRIVSGAIRGRRRRLRGRRQQRKDGGGRGGGFMVVLLAEKGRRRRDRRRNGRGASRGWLIRPQRCSPAVLSPVRRTWAGMWPCCVPRRRLAAAGSSTGRPRCCSTFCSFFVVVRADEKIGEIDSMAIVVRLNQYFASLFCLSIHEGRYQSSTTQQHPPSSSYSPAAATLRS